MRRWRVSRTPRWRKESCIPAIGMLNQEISKSSGRGRPEGDCLLFPKPARTERSTTFTAAARGQSPERTQTTRGPVPGFAGTVSSPIFRRHRFSVTDFPPALRGSLRVTNRCGGNRAVTVRVCVKKGTDYSVPGHNRLVFLRPTPADRAVCPLFHTDSSGSGSLKNESIVS